MADSSALRTQRSRLHKRHDHSLCRPDRCSKAAEATGSAEEAGSAVASADQPEFGPAGTQLWQDMTSGGPLPAMAMVLLREACRITDRLDRLHRQLAGEDWLTFEVGDSVVVVRVDQALAESRQQATALKQIVAEIRQFAGKGKSGSGKTSTPADASTQGKGGGIADLTSRIAERRDGSAG